MREAKKARALLQQIDIDTKRADIPEYWCPSRCQSDAPGEKQLGSRLRDPGCHFGHTKLHRDRCGRAALPRCQYIARDVSAGLLFRGCAAQMSLAYADLFAQRIIDHLRRCKGSMAATTWQFDNSSEFVDSCRSRLTPRCPRPSRPSPTRSIGRLPLELMASRPTWERYTT